MPPLKEPTCFFASLLPSSALSFSLFSPKPRTQTKEQAGKSTTTIVLSATAVMDLAANMGHRLPGVSVALKIRNSPN